jgi:hypothetical protein
MSGEAVRLHREMTVHLLLCTFSGIKKNNNLTLLSEFVCDKGGICPLCGWKPFLSLFLDFKNIKENIH